MTENQLRWIARICGPVVADLLMQDDPHAWESLIDYLRFWCGAGLIVAASLLNMLVG